MAEYIEREAAKKEFSLNFGGVSHAVIANRILDAIPAADVQPVVHGGWIAVKDFGGGHCVGYCNKCRTIHTASNATALKLEYRFCRWCGARMDGE